MGIMLLTLSGCSDTDTVAEAGLHSFHGPTMGTRYNITYVQTLAPASLSELQAGVDTVLAELNQSMSTYIADSELNRFNDHAVNEWMTVSAPLFSVIEQAQEISRLSAGAFDISVGPLVDLWGFGPTPGEDKIPSARQLSAVKNSMGYQAIELDKRQRRIRKTSARRLDLSAIAKGYATDMVAEYLERQGIDAYLVEVGGEVRLKGKKPNGDNWRIAIETPVSGQREAQRIVSLSNISIATSGDYRNYFEIDGQRYSHTIDPASGYPIQHKLVSVTVITEHCIEADGYATAMLVMGTEKSLALAEKLNMAVFLIEKTEQGFVEHKSAAFSSYTKEP